MEVEDLTKEIAEKINGWIEKESVVLVEIDGDTFKIQLRKLKNIEMRPKMIPAYKQNYNKVIFRLTDDLRLVDAQRETYWIIQRREYNEWDKEYHWRDECRSRSKETLLHRLRIGVIEYRDDGNDVRLMTPRVVRAYLEYVLPKVHPGKSKGPKGNLNANKETICR